MRAKPNHARQKKCVFRTAWFQLNSNTVRKIGFEEEHKIACRRQRGAEHIACEG